MKLRARDLIAAVAVVVMAGVCVRLGFWQISRLHEKQAMNAALARALTLPPVRVTDAGVPIDSVRGRRIAIDGTYDERRQFLLASHLHDGAPGVSVVTPLVLDDGRAVLVERGWLPAGDASTAHPERTPEPGRRTVSGIAEPALRGRRGPAPARIPADSASLWSMRWIDADSIGARVPYALAGFYVRQLPGDGVSGTPLRTVPAPRDESMHVNYAIQWFLFAVILVVGSGVLLWKKRYGTPGEPVPPIPRGPLDRS